MAKVRLRFLGIDRPIFDEGVTITTHRNDDGFAEYMWIVNELGKDRNYLK